MGPSFRRAERTTGASIPFLLSAFFVTFGRGRHPTGREPPRRPAATGGPFATADGPFPSPGEQDAITRPEPTRVQHVGGGRRGRPAGRLEREPRRGHGPGEEGPGQAPAAARAARLPRPGQLQGRGQGRQERLAPARAIAPRPRPTSARGTTTAPASAAAAKTPARTSAKAWAAAKCR